MRIADNKRNNRADADSNHMIRMQIPKNDNRIMRMRIFLIIASAFSPIITILFKFCNQNIWMFGCIIFQKQILLVFFCIRNF
jgi:hypothetical protein